MKRFLNAGEGCAQPWPPQLLIFLSLVVLLSSACSTFRQPETYKSAAPIVIGKYKIGDKLPPDFVIGYDPFDSTKIVRLSDFKNKAVIIDAWATWCGACISKFPMMDSISNHYGEQLEILMVDIQGRDTPEIVRDFVINYKKNNPNFNPTFLIEDDLQKAFTFRNLPHYIWIDPNRRVRAFTNPQAFEEEHLTRLIAGMPVYAPIKPR